MAWDARHLISTQHQTFRIVRVHDERTATKGRRAARERDSADDRHVVAAAARERERGKRRRGAAALRLLPLSLAEGLRRVAKLAKEEKERRRFGADSTFDFWMEGF